jgi:hypothetical protein
MDVTFSVNMHDKDGDVFDKCILLHFNDTFILKISDLKELDNTIKQLQDIKTEITENYNF